MKESQVSNWLIEDGFPSKGMLIEDGFAKIQHGEFKISKGTIMFYDCASDEFVPCAVQYDGAPDPWGSTKNYEEQEVHSGHEWVSSETINPDGSTREEFYTWSWNISDGWSEADAIGLPGLYQVDKMWFYNNRLCQSCRIVTPKVNPECEHCGYTVAMKVS